MALLDNKLLSKHKFSSFWKKLSIPIIGGIIMQKALKFDNVCLEYLKHYGDFETIKERIDLIIRDILISINSKLETKISKYSKSGYIVTKPKIEEWTSSISLKLNNKSSIMKMTYGFENETPYSHVNRETVNFVIWVTIFKEGNGFKDMKELKSFWRDEIESQLENDDYIIPIKDEDDDAYAYYDIYTIHDSKIRSVKNKKENLTYAGQVIDAFNYEFTKKFTRYDSIKNRVKKWRLKLKKDI